MAEVSILEALKKSKAALARVQTHSGKNYIGFFEGEFFYGVPTNDVKTYVSQKLRGKELKMQIPEMNSVIIYFDDEDSISFDECTAQLDRATKIQADYALADVFDNLCDRLDRNS